MKRILVTGGAGFLGSHLCRRLLQDNANVICMDNFYTGKKSNILDLLSNSHFELIKHDVTVPYTALIKPVDEIYNLACPASPIWYQKEAIKTFMTSILGAKNALDSANAFEAKVFQPSTSEIYGDAEEYPQTENYWGNVNPIGIRSCYDEGKRGAESLFFDYYRKNRTRIKVVRIFNTYGPYMAADDGRVISNFIVQALKNEPLTIYGDGNQTRSFCYVSDMIDAFIRFMATDDTELGPINLGNPEEFTIKELAHKIIELTKSNSKIEFRPLPKDDPKKRKPSIAKAKALLHWTPHIHLEEGLEKTIEYFKRDVQFYATPSIYP